MCTTCCMSFLSPSTVYCVYLGMLRCRASAKMLHFRHFWDQASVRSLIRNGRARDHRTGKEWHCNDPAWFRTPVWWKGLWHQCKPSHQKHQSWSFRYTTAQIYSLSNSSKCSPGWGGGQPAIELVPVFGNVKKPKGWFLWIQRCRTGMKCFSYLPLMVTE